TFAGGPVVARAALAALEVTDDPELLARVGAVGERLREEIAGLPGVSEVRGRGLMVGFDLEAGGAPELVGAALAAQKIVINATGPQTVRLLPPLTITDDEVATALERLAAALEGHGG
ncbi:MAG: aminotransferase class III-fold pyridoxal phosphate-dependent enzyme, partial [Solirubrobacteraceae bacterium]|nr:aminotransferase class III-fold pyridoxal phosphate-dependent enzyme [Solirubrobacteraceae bacterium]